MQNWWLSLSLFEKTLWFITIPASVIFLGQMILTFSGMDSNGDLDTDIDDPHDHSGPFQLFTFRNFINFFLGFGWTALTLNSHIGSKAIVVILAALAGVLLVAAVMYIFYSLSQLQQSGTMDIRNALHQVGEVYLTIPPSQSGQGKIHVRIQGNLRELDAVTRGPGIPSGQRAVVTGIINDNLLLVEPF